MKENKCSVHSIIINTDLVGQRVDNFLRTYLKGVPNNMICRIVRKGEVRINKRRIKLKYKLQEGDLVRIPPVRQVQQKRPTFAYLKKNNALYTAVLYEDDYLLILNKSAGVAVHGGSGLDFGLIEGLRVARPRERYLELVHRLDKDTSGVLIIAKKRSVLRALHEQLRQRKIRKNYLALVCGQWNPNVTTVSAPLFKNILSSKLHAMQVSTEYGKPSETRFVVKERFGFATLVVATPITGRTHQIRVHARYVGNPVASDVLYGGGLFNNYNFQQYGLNRLFLHASNLSFIHPNNGEMLYVEAPLDASLCRCLSFLRKFSINFLDERQ